MSMPIYMDYQATTPMDPRVFEAMTPWFVEKFGNPASRSHPYGWEADTAVENARQQVASSIGADPREIIFTSGATESDNLAIAGVAKFYKDKGNHIITPVTEHKAVLDTCRYLEQEGFEVTYLPVQKDGLVNMAELEAAITDKTVLVSIMAVNNEIGVIQPLAQIGALCRRKKVFFHCDAAQGVGKMPIDVNEMNIDLMSISGHKIYGPKGIGALYVRRRPRVRVNAIIHGGGHERGMRSGTLSTPLIVGLGEACRLATEEMVVEEARVLRLREKLRTALESQMTHVQTNGSLEHRIAGNLNISFEYVEGESMMMAIKDVAVSSGSACTSASLEPSYVLRSLGLNDEMAHTSIRFGLGRFTTEEEVDAVIKIVTGAVDKLREMSPLWEMVQEGIDLSSIKWAEH
ncbi:cysteine desulfurase IscS [Magnetococcus marinus MC-1]|uniref:Cysteine desulfurase IscS n=1 Tax=Magnetococcus marinus (strain ATCC BAA-1437 / JCM 17883 / MC-1) TaxID=156889 RepID=A0LC60_MAGMM|nr:IscS subfamily cysteine desulfurase [Magnetococcus marinus]ABK45553.1 cysteine desulfurase IscS [Magnetococcus marinus MC-1]